MNAFVPSPAPEPSLTPTALAGILGALAAAGTALSYLVRLGQLISKLDRLHQDMERVQAAHEQYARTAAEHAVEIEALRRDVNRLLDATA